ncbi:tetratricopeptide repeat-containing sulfotransferase family protein [Maricaulaceae bacterium MS644]
MDPDALYTAAMREAEKMAARGERGEAIAALKGFLEAYPGAFDAWIRLGNLLYHEQRYAEAVQAVKAAERADPLAAQFQLIQRAMQSRDFAQAGSVANAMLEKHPGHPRAVFTLAHLASSRGDHEGAVAILENALRLSPANLVLRTMLIGALEHSGAYRRAIAAAKELARIEESFDSLWPLIMVLLRYGRNDEALEACDRAERHVNSAPAKQSAVKLVRGQIRRITGDREASIDLFRASLADDPRNAAAWWALADMKTYAFSQAEQQAIRALSARPDIDRKTKSIATFALAKAHETEDDGAASMPLYIKANALHNDHAFDPQRFDAAADRLVQAYTAETVSAQAAAAPGGATPIFIVGLPRSGSTLVEQILASHSQIEATIEQPTLPAVKRTAHLRCVERFGGDYLSNIGRMPQSDLEALGRAYLEESTLFRTGDRAFFTDKMPNNFEHVGLIHKILPNAVIIDVRRNPMDCGFSLFKQYFAQGVDFSYNLKDIGSYYNGYLKIMDHWDRVLPGKVLHVQYEDLVRSPEPMIQTLLAGVGVAFEPGCLKFHETRRAVRTASSEQVRRPLYSEGVGAWRAVEAHLEDLKIALGPQTLNRFRDRL